MEYYAVGQIINTFGIKGEVRLLPLTSDIERFNLSNPYYLGISKKKIHVEKFWPHKGTVVVKFKEFSNIDDVELLKGEYVYVSEEDLYPLKEDEYFQKDLIGMLVYEDGELIGKLIKVIEGLSSDTYEIENKDGSFYVPAVKEFILNVDVEKGRMDIRTIEGMR